MPNSDCDVLVVGAGVSGLTTAICLADAGIRTLILAAAPPPETTSAVAGAIWGPHLVEASARTTRWRRQTLAVLRELATDPATGVRIVAGVEAARDPSPDRPASDAAPDAPASDPSRPGPAPPEWLRDLGGAARSVPGSLPAGFVSGWRYAAPLAHMPTYLGYLRARFEAAGGHVEAGAVRSLAGAARDHRARAVVNCTGTGARELAADPAVTPFRGQVVVAENPGIGEFFIGLPDSGTELVYLFPHGDIVILGGTEVAEDWNTEPVPAVADRILRDCAGIDPRLEHARVLAHRVGLRPFRPRVRLEAEPPGPGGPGPGRADAGQGEAARDDGARTGPGSGPAVVHNYGHGGAGVTMSWGCAREAAALAAQALG